MNSGQNIWGIKSFENETAIDLADSMISDNIGSIELFDIINRIVHGSDNDPENGPDNYDACRAIAAIEFVAAAKQHPCIDLPDSVKQWLQKNDPLNISIGGFLGFGKRKIDIIEYGKKAIDQVKRDSELKEFWTKKNRLSEWMTAMDDLNKRIS